MPPSLGKCRDESILYAYTVVLEGPWTATIDGQRRKRATLANIDGKRSAGAYGSRRMNLFGESEKVFFMLMYDGESIGDDQKLIDYGQPYLLD